jgi:pentatricopeptide repeat protein
MLCCFPLSLMILFGQSGDQIDAARQLFNRMQEPKNTTAYPTPNIITYTSIMSAYIRQQTLACYQKAIDVYKTIPKSITPTYTILRYVLTSCVKLKLGQTAVAALDQMKSLEIPLTIHDYHDVITSCITNTYENRGDDGIGIGVGVESVSITEIISFLKRMKCRNLQPTLLTYNIVISACNRQGNWKDAIVLLEEMKENDIKPDTVSYSTIISCCVNDRQWRLSLELLERMEVKNIERNIITYNSVIEALDRADESVRAELVYQSALRASIYSHWASNVAPDQIGISNLLSINSNNEKYKMDLHKFPTTVAKAAIMHVLSEMCTGVLPTSRLIVVCGRGNHINRVGTRGVLQMELDLFFKSLGI